MYIDKYEIVSIGSVWNNGKEKKNQIVSQMTSKNGINARKFLQLIGDFEHTHHEYGSECEIKVIFKGEN